MKAFTAVLTVSGFARWKDRARAPPGEVEDTERTERCQARLLQFPGVSDDSECVSL